MWGRVSFLSPHGKIHQVVKMISKWDSGLTIIIDYALRTVLVKVESLLIGDTVPNKFVRFAFSRKAKIIFSIYLKFYYRSFAPKIQTSDILVQIIIKMKVAGYINLLHSSEFDFLFILPYSEHKDTSCHVWWKPSQLTPLVKV